ncbi:MAG TPA: hypothetical protein VG435_15745 [Acidimicrobiales bacterium]|jgi:hypothetical protein|nr:hypothetical protein [Acidimicrobiales bacterium]
MSSIRRRATRRPIPIVAALAASASSVVFQTGAASAAVPAPGATDRLSSNFALAVGPSAGLPTTTRTQTGCTFGNSAVQHVFYIGFDNFHLRRDNANTVANNGDDNNNTDLNIPSDLEQVPALYNFLRGAANAPAGSSNTGYTDGTPYPGGTILGNDHTPIISHTSVDFTSAYTGVYGDQNGVATAQNSLAAYTGNTYTGGTSTASQAVGTNGSGFGFWTDPVSISTGSGTTLKTDPSQQFITPGSTTGSAVNAPAPWVPFTRAGCDVGSVSATTMVLENQNSVNDANAQPGGGSTGANLTTADEGLSVHCAATGSSICDYASSDPNVKAVGDNLPAEPGAPYTGTATTGYRALYGTRYVAPAVNDGMNGSVPAGGGSTTLRLLRSGSTTANQSSVGATAFPGFNSEDGNYTLGYTLDMQKAGIPVTFGYLTTAHNCYSGLSGDYSVPPTSPVYASSTSTTVCNHTDASGNSTQNAVGAGGAFGSGEQGYVNYLKNLNTDFQTFFDQAQAAGFTTANTEFVFYSDESDNIAEGTPANPTCDGVTTPCQWLHSSTQTTPVAGQMGELTMKLDTANSALVRGGATSYVMLSDSAPEFYVEEQGAAGSPSQSDPNVRNMERQVGSTTYTDPYTGTTGVKLAKFQADQTELNAMHMVTADPSRTPTFVTFAPGEDFVETGFPSDCGSTTVATCTNSGFVGVHGDFAPETFTTWAGLAGPDVRTDLGGVTNVFTDHTDMRPTLLALLGLHDDYETAGRVISEIIQPGTVLPASGQSATVQQLGIDLKKVSAPTYGATETSDTAGFGPATLVADTTAIQGGSAGDDHIWTTTDSCISTLTNERNLLVGQIHGTLDSADGGTSVDGTGPATAEDAQATNLVSEADQLQTYAAGTGALPADCANIGQQLPEVGHTALFVVVGGAIFAGIVFFAGRRGRRKLAI